MKGDTMKAVHTMLTRANPVHWQKAQEKAFLSIKEDRRLIGVPQVRDELIEVAALKALGAEVSVDKKTIAKVDPGTYDVMIDALNKAYLKAKNALRGLPPLRQNVERAA
jgi:hypothetical protein